MTTITTPVQLHAVLDRGVSHPCPLPMQLICGNDQAHEFIVGCSRNGSPADLTECAAYAYMRRADGVTIPLETVIDGSTGSPGGAVRFMLTAPCYAVPGFCTISMDLESGAVRATHLVCTAYVGTTRTDDEDPTGRPGADGNDLPNCEEAVF